MVRMMLGAAFGIGTAFLTVWLLQRAGHAAFPPPADLDPTDTEAFRAYVQGLPVAALGFVLASYVIAAFDGVLVACLIARMKYHIFATVVGGLLLVVTIANLIMIPHPIWFSAASVIGIPLAAAAAALIASRIFPARQVNE